MIIKKFIGMFIVLAVLLGFIAMISFAQHISGSKKAMENETQMVDEKLNRDASQGKLAGEVELENQFSNESQGLGQQISDNLQAQSELEDSGGDWIDPEKDE